MRLMDVKQNLAINLAKYRKANKMTQADLAEKLNYSDKAVSKWERAEAVPDLAVLKQISDLYGVTIDKLIDDPKDDKIKGLGNVSKKRFLIALSAAGLVWLIACLCYAVIGIIIPSTIGKTWLFFIYAIPLTFLIFLIFSSVWKNRVIDTLSSSILSWTAILSIFLSLKHLMINPPEYLWYIFLIGIGIQVLIILWFVYRKIK